MSMRAWIVLIGLGLISWAIVFWAIGLYSAPAMFYAVIGLAIVTTTLDSWLDTKAEQAQLANQVQVVLRALRLGLPTTFLEERALDQAAQGYFEDELDELRFEQLLERARRI